MVLRYAPFLWVYFVGNAPSPAACLGLNEARITDASLRFRQEQIQHGISRNLWLLGDDLQPLLNHQGGRG
jgi:hypothetical protein